MATEVYEDGLDLQIGLIEAVMPSEASEESRQSYPYPRLRPTGEEEMRTFRTIVLENPFLRVIVIPGLGGRVLSLFDKRTSTEILRRHPALLPVEGGRRGATMREGIQLRLGPEDRLNALGNVDSLVQQPMDDESPGGVWIGEAVGGTGLSFHLHLELPPDRAELLVEARVFNRTFEPVAYNGSLTLYLGDGEIVGNAFYSSERDAGLTIEPASQPLDDWTHGDGVLRIGRFTDLRDLAPRQLDTWSVRLVPYSRLGRLTAATREVAAYLGSDLLRVQTTEQRLGHKLLLLTEDGQTLEAPADLYPEHLLEVPLEALPSRPVALVVQGPAKEEVLRTDVGARRAAPATPSQISRARHASPLRLETDDLDLRRAAFDVADRHLAHTLRGTRALARRDFEEAEHSFEQALLFNAEDHLSWWTKAVAGRLTEVGDEERPELLNAHYLAPLEPALRAEAFLSQSPSMGKEPSPLLASLEDTPDSFVEVACLFVEAGLCDQATRWIDEALRHTDLAMLHYLQAYCFLTGSRMTIEAADHLAAAERLPFGPPFPWRSIELKTLGWLYERFPQHDRIGHMLRFATPAHT